MKIRKSSIAIAALSALLTAPATARADIRSDGGGCDEHNGITLCTELLGTTLHGWFSVDSTIFLIAPSVAELTLWDENGGHTTGYFGIFSPGDSGELYLEIGTAQGTGETYLQLYGDATPDEQNPWEYYDGAVSPYVAWWTD